MAQLGQTFDANQVQPQTDFAPIPAGDYTAMIIDSQMKPTKTGRGQYLELTLQVIDGQFANRMIWDRLTLVHDNPKTVEIAQRQLSAICHAVGVLQVQDSAQLHNLPMVVRLKYIDDQQYGAKNEVASYKPAQAGHAPAPQQGVAQPQAQPAQQSMPWGGQPQPSSAPPAQPQAQPQPQAAAAPPWARA